MEHLPRTSVRARKARAWRLSVDADEASPFLRHHERTGASFPGGQLARSSKKTTSPHPSIGEERGATKREGGGERRRVTRASRPTRIRLRGTRRWQNEHAILQLLAISSRAKAVSRQSRLIGRKQRVHPVPRSQVPSRSPRRTRGWSTRAQKQCET